MTNTIYIGVVLPYSDKVKFDALHCSIVLSRSLSSNVYIFPHRLPLTNQPNLHIHQQHSPRAEANTECTVQKKVS